MVANGFSMHGEPTSISGSDLLARAIQHETDHLNGIVYVDRIEDMTSLSFIAEWQRYTLGFREQQD